MTASMHLLRSFANTPIAMLRVDKAIWRQSRVHTMTITRRFQVKQAENAVN
jgi:hypothetical protein